MSQPQRYPYPDPPERDHPDQVLRDIRKDLRFLSYRAGRPHPFVVKLLLIWLLLMFAPLVIAGLWVAIAGPFKTPVHQSSPISHQPKEIHP